MNNTTPTHPSFGVSGDGVGIVEILIQRGVVEANATALAVQYPAERISRAVAYYDGLAGVGPGVLVKAIREGRAPQPQRRDIYAESAEYGRSMHAWTREHMPDLIVAGYAHPAVIAALIRLHKRHGRGSVTVGEHGDWIRAFVADWRERRE